MVDERKEEHWNNFAADGGWSDSVQACTNSPFRNCYPVSLSDLVQIVHDAESNGKRARAVGSGWSFSAIVKTDDFLVQTDKLNKNLGDLHGILGRPLWKGTNPAEISGSALNSSAMGHRLVHFEAGVKLHELMAFLDQQGMAPFTLGGAEGQSLAGAVATSVHGSDFALPPLPDSVRAIHLVGPGGVQYWIEPTQGITDHAALQQKLALFGVLPEHIIYDDEWFNAALVSVGCFGIVYSYIFEVRDQYDLWETTVPMPWSSADPRTPNVVNQLTYGNLFETGNRFVQVTINPVASNGVHSCYLTTRIEKSNPSAPIPEDRGLEALGDLTKGLPPGKIGDIIGDLFNGQVDLTGKAIKMIMDNRIAPKHGWAHTVMAGGNPIEKFLRGYALEVAFSAETPSGYLGFIDRALQILQDFQGRGQVLGGWMSIRFVGRSRAFLSPTQRFSRTCMIEFVSLRKYAHSEEILRMLEQTALDMGGVQHWGMMFENPINLRTHYPALNRWQRIRCILTRNGALRTFDNIFSERCGLSAGNCVPQKQDGWRACVHCSALFYLPSDANRCASATAAAGRHLADENSRYTLFPTPTLYDSESGWRWCRKCGVLFNAEPDTIGKCPADAGQHDGSASWIYDLCTVASELDFPWIDNWRGCQACQALFDGTGAGSICARNGARGHDGAHSRNHFLMGTLTVSRPGPIPSPLTTHRPLGH